MVGSGDGEEGLRRGAVRIVLPRHIAGHEAVRLPVGEQHRHAALFQRLRRARRLRVEAPEDARAQPHEEVDGRDGQMALADDLFEDVARRGVAAVGDDAAHAGGQIERAGHQHRGRAHGDAVQIHRRGMIARLRPLRPGEAVPPLVDAEGDGPAAALSVRALIDEDEPEPLRAVKRQNAAKIPRRRRTPAVKEQQKRLARLRAAHARVQPQAVEGSDLRFLKGQAAIAVLPRAHRRRKAPVARLVEDRQRLFVFVAAKSQRVTYPHQRPEQQNKSRDDDERQQKPAHTPPSAPRKRFIAGSAAKASRLPSS